MTASSMPAAHALADRLRVLPESRWSRSLGQETVAAAGLRMAQLLADLAARIEAYPAEVAPTPRVPDLGPFAVPDQLTVLAVDLENALAAVDPSDLPEPLADALERAQQELRALTGAV